MLVHKSLYLILKIDLSGGKFELGTGWETERAASEEIERLQLREFEGRVTYAVTRIDCWMEES